jgi:hypothetical protein
LKVKCQGRNKLKFNRFANAQAKVTALDIRLRDS